MVRRYNAFLLLRLVGTLVGLPTFYAYADGQHVSGHHAAGCASSHDWVGGTITVQKGSGVVANGSYQLLWRDNGGNWNNFGAPVVVSGGVITSGGTITATLLTAGSTLTNPPARNIAHVKEWTYTGGPILATKTYYDDGQLETGSCPNPASVQTGTDNFTLYLSGTPPKTTRWVGAVQVNCSTQHALGLVVDGVTLSYQVTSIFATKAAPSTVQFDITLDETTANGAPGKPWIISVDGTPTKSGTIQFPCPSGDVYCTNSGQNVTWQLPPTPPRTDATVVFDCAPPSGTLNLNGTLTIPPSGSGHTLSVKFKGSTVGSTSSPGGSAQQTSITLTKVVENANNGDSVEWYVDGVLVKTDIVALNCSYNAEMQQTYCSGTSTYSGTATQNASPTPTATPKPTPSPTAPPQNPQYTPPPPPTYTPPPPQSTPTGGGDVRVMNPESIYQPIVDALKVDNAGTASRNNSASGTGADFSARGHLDDLQPQVDKAVEKVDAIKDKGVSAITSLKDSFSTLPTSLGTVSTVNFGTGLFNGIGPTAARFTTLPTSVDLTPYMTGINLARTVMLWALTIFFGFLTVRAFTWTQ